jgi:hypothetical protein
MQYVFTHVNQFYHSLVSAVCRGRIITVNSTPTICGADGPSFLAMEDSNLVYCIFFPFPTSYALQTYMLRFL